MQILLVIFLITKTQQYSFNDQVIQNETFIATNQVQQLNNQSEKTSWISNKVLMIIMVCLSIIVITT
jgi:hypothetical protein